MGLAVLRNRLYSVHQMSPEVFIHDTNDPFIRLRHPKVDGMTWPRGIAASQRHRCVFITDWYRTFRGKLWRATKNIKEVRLYARAAPTTRVLALIDSKITWIAQP